jgi:hypothetical protein
MNFGMTHLVIHSAPAAFLPPAIELSAMVRVNSLASALGWVGGLVLALAQATGRARGDEDEQSGQGDRPPDPSAGSWHPCLPFVKEGID